MCYNESTGTINENKVDMKAILLLATELGLPCVERGTVVYIIGEEQILEFKAEEKYMEITNKCEQLDKLNESILFLEEYIKASNKGSEYAVSGHMDDVLNQLEIELQEQAEIHGITLSKL